jgi:hypothetical protein
MSEFLLAGKRPAVTGEVSPWRAAQDLADLAAWHRWLRRWGLLRSFGLPPGPGREPRVCLIVQASGLAAAQQLAAAWGRIGGYEVTVVELHRPAAGAGG